jgi:hypothetical protein
MMICFLAAAQKADTNGPSEIKILSRKEWGAKPPVAEMKRHDPTRITIHHTATLQKPDRLLKQKMRALQDFSQREGKLGDGKPKPAWPDVPYHFYIASNGEVAEGRDVSFIGDTNTKYNPSGHVLIVLEGNFEEEQPTVAQVASLGKMIAWLTKRYDVPPEKIGGHKDFAETLCPGKNLHKLIPEMAKRL